MPKTGRRDMADGETQERHPLPLGSVEPQAGLLTVPPDSQLLCKVMKPEHLFASISGQYLHFNRVDGYKDFPGADPADGQQLPADRPGNEKSTFIKAPTFSMADSYDLSRSRTYACCFSLEDSEHIWHEYAKGGANGKVCLVFSFPKLRAALNSLFEPGNSALSYNGLRCHQIFSINYGKIEYVDWAQHQANATHLPNPIQYTYLKDKSFEPEKELRVSLSAIGLGKFAMNDGSEMPFPQSLPVAFNFKRAFADGTILQIHRSVDCSPQFLKTELEKLGIGASGI